MNVLEVIACIVRAGISLIRKMTGIVIPAQEKVIRTLLMIVRYLMVLHAV
jgi:hypothetical protein